MQIDRKRRLILTLTSLIVMLLTPRLGAQDIYFSEGFMGRGIAMIFNGDVETARQEALIDAQRKSIMTALGARLSLEDIANHFQVLKTLFIGRPDIYLQSFKIIHENSVFDTYQLSIQGLMQQEILKKDLESLGLLGPEKEKIRVLFMIAEKTLASPENYHYWWSSAGTPAIFSESEQKLKEKFIARGFSVIDPFQTVHEFSAQSSYQDPEPDLALACRLGSQWNAEIIILGKTEVKRNEEESFSSLKVIQSSIKTTAVSVKSKEILVSAASYGLGVNIDETAASKEAIEKATAQLSEQITDKLQMQIQSIRKQSLQLRVSGPVLQAEIRQWLDSLKETFPEIKETEVTEKQGQWLVMMQGPLKTAAMLERIFEQGIAGYHTEVVTTSENLIELMVKPQEKKSEEQTNFMD